MPRAAAPSDPGGRAAPALTARLAGSYLLLQAVAVGAWWAALSASATFRAGFELGDPAVLNGYRLPDAALAAASVAAAVLALRARPSAGVLAAVTLGVVLCSTLATVADVVASGSGTIGAAAMAGASAGTAAALLLLRRAFP